MRHGVPSGYGVYGEVLLRLGGEFRPQGAGLTFECPFGERHPLGHDRTPSAFVRVGDRGQLMAYCNGCGAGWALFREYVGLPVGAWFPDQGEKQRRGGRAATGRRAMSKVVAEYPYHHFLTGDLLAVKRRWEPGFDGVRAKDFDWMRPLPDRYRKPLGVPADAFAWCTGPGVLKGGEFAVHRTDRDGTRWLRPAADTDSASVRLEPVEVGPYRENECHRSDPAHSVFVVEGEGKADLLWGIGCVATSGPAGKGKWEAGWGTMFQGRAVVVVPDPDGVDWGCRVLASAIGHNATSVCLVENPAGQGDVKDWLPRPGGRAAMRQFLKSLVDKSLVYTKGVRG